MSTPSVIHLASPGVANDRTLAGAIDRIGGRLLSAKSLDDLAAQLTRPTPPDVVVLDFHTCDGACRGGVLSVRTQAPSIGLVVRVEVPDEASTVWLIERGVDDVAALSGFGVDRLARCLQRVIERGAYRCRRALRPDGDLNGTAARLGTEIDAVDRPIAALALSAAVSNRPALLLGEPGTGKTRLAHQLHAAGRSSGPMVVFRAEALPESVVQTRLFQSEARAKSSTSGGAAERARGGTLLIEDVNTLPRSAQSELMRRLDEGDAAFRLVATSVVPLEPIVRSRQFSSDLLARLAALRIELPPLRARRYQIPALVTRILDECRGISLPPVERVAPDALRALISYHWPGNLRELEEVLRRAVGLARDTILTRDTLPAALTAGTNTASPGLDQHMAVRQLKPQLKTHLDLGERLYLERLLTRYHGGLSECTEHAGIARRRLVQRLRRHGLDPDAYRALADSPEPGRQLFFPFEHPANASDHHDAASS